MQLYLTKTFSYLFDIFLPSNTTSKDVALALDELNFEVKDLKQMTSTCYLPTTQKTISLPIFQAPLVGKHNSQSTLTLTGACNVMTVESTGLKTTLMTKNECFVNLRVYEK